jgi:hypothetical protein
MSAGLSCVIKNERPEGDFPGLECHSKKYSDRSDLQLGTNRADKFV